MSPYYYQNYPVLCEFCELDNMFSKNDGVVFDLFIKHSHCDELRRNRKSRKNKNYEPKNKVF